MNDLDKQLSERLRQNVKEPPASVVDRINKTLDTLPETKKRAPKNYKVIASVVAALFLVMIISMPMYQSVIQQGVNENSIKDSIFQVVGEEGLQQLSEDGFTFPMNISATSNGITLEITEVMFDGTRLYFGFIETHAQPINLIGVPDEDWLLKESRFFIGERGNYYHMLGGKPTRQLSETRLAGVFGSPYVGDVDQLKDINITVYRSGNYAGEWEFIIDEIPIIEGINTTIVEEAYLVDDLYELYIEKVIQTPVTIEIYYTFDYPIDSRSEEPYELTLRDLEREPYEGLYIGGGTDENRMYRVLAKNQEEELRLQMNKFKNTEEDNDLVKFQNVEPVLDIVIELDK